MFALRSLYSSMKLDRFLKKAKYPLVVISTLPSQARSAVVDFVHRLNMPVYVEGISGLREDPRLRQRSITYISDLWKNAAAGGYPIDGILRIGGVPTFRPWRDLEDKQDTIAVCSISHLPFTGLSGGDVEYGPLEKLLPAMDFKILHEPCTATEWIARDQACESLLCDLFVEEPMAETSLVHFLSKQIPQKSVVYIGNSLPIREWDLAAERQDKEWDLFASRGVNGIDGQISTFLGLCMPDRENWGIVGDLTALYDMAGPWIMKQLQLNPINLVVINNGGGQIFSLMFPNHKEFLNEHALSFGPLAEFWGMEYERWTKVPESISTPAKHRIIEMIPDPEATERFWKKYQTLFQLTSSYAGV